jgi:hypothetical protein
VNVMEDPANAVFVSATGSDGNLGTRVLPFATIQAAIGAAAGAGNGADVYVVAGTFVESITLASGVSIYGGFSGTSWLRDPKNLVTTISGGPKAVVGRGVSNLWIDGLTIVSADAITLDASSYALQLVESNDVVISGNVITAGRGAAGQDGAAGADGAPGENGAPGGGGNDDGCCGGFGGAGGSGPGYPGGHGGRGGSEGRFNGNSGGWGSGPCSGPGGFGGSWSNPGRPGGNGASGGLCHSGPAASGTPDPTSTFQYGPEGFSPPFGGSGADGGPGAGGGGGGGGGGQSCTFCDDGSGNGGGGGGAGGGGGRGGRGARGGGGSFAIYLYATSGIVITDNTLATRGGGTGGRGGNFGLGGPGGAGGPGGRVDTDEVGAGGHGGNGGPGELGGFGASGNGGPSIGLFEGAVVNAAELSGNSFDLAPAGAGGSRPTLLGYVGHAGFVGERAETKSLP